MAKSNRAGVTPQPGQDEIARRAYQLFLQRGSVPGHETDDWLQAEAELSAASGSSASLESDAQVKRPAPESPNARRETGSSGRRTLRQ